MRTSLWLSTLVAIGLAALHSLPVPAAGPGDASEIQRLIDKLGSNRFAEREDATHALDAVGETALPDLRNAESNQDAEIRRRALDLVQRIEQRADSNRLLAPTKVTLSFKDTPLSDALAELSKQSGCPISLQDPKGKLKDRKITLSTTESGFWEAFERICTRGHIIQDSLLPSSVLSSVGGAQSGITAPPAGGLVRGGNVIVRPMPMVELLTLVDGTPPPLPACSNTSVRIVAVRTPGGDGGDHAHIPLSLVVTAEPKVRCQEGFSLRIEKAIDDRGQELAPVDDGIPEYVYYVRRGPMYYAGGGVSVQTLQARLKTGEKPAKSLREVRGTLSARMVTEPRPLIIIDDILHATGKTFPGKEGGAIKVLAASQSDAGKVSLRIELELSAAQTSMFGYFGGPGRFRPGKMPVPAAAPPVPMAATTSARRRTSTLSLIDDKGDALPPSGLLLNQRGGNLLELTLEFALASGREAAKFVYSGSKSVAVEIPFVLNDVPVP